MNGTLARTDDEGQPRSLLLADSSFVFSQIRTRAAVLVVRDDPAVVGVLIFAAFLAF